MSDTVGGEAVISFEELVLGGTMPIYLQLIMYIKRGIAAGTIKNGDELPSRRMLSALLGVNPNTIQKAYRILEEEGLICSHTGAKSYAVVTETKIAQIRRELLEQEVQTLVDAMKQMGVTREEAIEMIAALWERGGAE